MDHIKHHIRLHVQYSLPEDEHKVFETCRRQEDLNTIFVSPCIINNDGKEEGQIDATATVY